MNKTSINKVHLNFRYLFDYKSTDLGLWFLFVLLKLPPLYTWTTLWPHDATFECIGQLFLVPCKATHLRFKSVQQTDSLWCYQSHDYFPKLCCLMLHCLSSSVLSVVLFMDWAKTAKKKQWCSGEDHGRSLIKLFLHWLEEWLVLT